MAYTIKLKRGTKTEWEDLDPILEDGEMGIDTDSNNFKVGDGVTTWKLLAYYITGNLPYTPEDIDNKVSAWQVTPDDTHYPTEKLVKDELDGKQETLISGDTIKTINTYSILGSGNITVTTDPADLTGFVKFTGSTQALNLTGYDITGKIGNFHTITVTSSAVISNLNADKLDGNEASAFATATHTHATYVPYTGGSSNLNLTGYGVTGTTGKFDTLTINLTSLISNLNADKLDGLEGSTYSTTAHTHASYVPFTGGSSNLNLTGYGVTGTTGKFDTLTINLTSLISNLNADLLDGNEASAFATSGHNHSGVYEPVISSGTTGQFWRGDKSWQNYSVIISGFSPTSVTSGHIPYTGAVSAVDLNGQSLTTTSTGIFSALKVPTNPTSGNVLTSDESGNAFWAVPGAGAWGGITGTLSAQTDLQNALNNRVPYTSAVSSVDLNSQALTAGATRLNSLSLATTGLATNLNADLLDGLEGSTYSTTAHTHASYVPYIGGSSDLNLTGYGVTGTTGKFDTLTINLTSLISNLNADKLDGLEGSTYSTTAHTHNTYVPYSGAGTAVDLNTQNITAGLGTYSSLTTTGTINSSGNVSVSGSVYCSQIRIYNTSDMSKELIFQVNSNQLNDLTYTWPDGYGGLNQVLTTDGSGGLNWATASGTGGSGLTQAQVLARTLGS